MRWFVPHLGLDKLGWRIRKGHIRRALMQPGGKHALFANDRHGRSRHRRRFMRQRINFDLRRQT